MYLLSWFKYSECRSESLGEDKSSNLMNFPHGYLTVSWYLNWLPRDALEWPSLEVFLYVFCIGNP